MGKSALRIRKAVVQTPPIKPGQKVKVYSGTKVSNQVIRYGEVLGIRERDKKLLLNERPGFKDLSVSQFHHYREKNQVVFMNSIPETHWKPMLADVQGVVINQGKEVNNG